ncbi:MAG: PH domain-containing protein [Bacillota bacterium]
MRVYRPAPSSGWISLIVMGLLLTAASLPAFAAGWQAALPARAILLAVAFGSFALGVWFLIMTWWFPTLHYELGPEELVLRYGPFRYPIKLREIQRISVRNLRWSLWSSMRFPGFAMWTVPYSDVGSVFMCATRSVTNLVYIETCSRNYGITPADEAAFQREIEAYLKG